ncbi:MAG: fluoroquinolone resistance protein [Flavobacteriales bacterium]|jgi:fluoroquinolone resistance protein
MSFDIEQREHYDCDYHGLSLDGQILQSLEFEACRFTACNFSGAKIQGCKFLDCSFVNCNLNVVSLSYSCLIDVIFESCKLRGIDWTLLNWDALGGGVQFKECQLDESSFYGLDLPATKMAACQIRDVDFSEENFSRTDFSGSDLAGSTFRSTNLSASNFSGALDYNIDIRMNTLKGTTFSRGEATNLLLSMGVDLVD